LDDAADRTMDNVEKDSDDHDDGDKDNYNVEGTDSDYRMMVTITKLAINTETKR